MPTSLPAPLFLAESLPLIDVRSPREHAQGHIPGAVNIPLFSDAERAVVGTLYKMKGREDAMLEGLRITGPKLAGIVEQARALAPNREIGVHCWRGGERSASVAWLLEKAGFSKVTTLVGGYKAFRKLVLESFQAPRHLLILGGFTGTGKTELLHRLAEEGAQTLDLEGLACHKGSAYGGIGEGQQPTTEQFENLLWHHLAKVDPQRRVWLEDESQMVGRVKIPDALFAHMRYAPVQFVDMPVERRAQRLVDDYGALPKEELAAATLRIQKRLGPQHAQVALAALEGNDLLLVARTVLNYYDKTYARGLAKRDTKLTTIIPAGELSLEQLVQKLKEHERTTAH